MNLLTALFRHAALEVDAELCEWHRQPVSRDDDA